MARAHDQRTRSTLHLAAVLWLIGFACDSPAPHDPSEPNNATAPVAYTEWLRLAHDATRAARPAPSESPAALTFRDAKRRTYRLEERDSGTWLETTLRAADWVLDPNVAGGAWRADAPLQSVGRPPPGSAAQRLESGAQTYTYSPPNRLEGSWSLPPGSFSAGRKGVHLKLEEGESPPVEATLSVYVGQRRYSSGVWRISGKRFSGDGFALHSGESIELDIDLPKDGGSLRFATTSEPAVFAAQPAGSEIVFRVSLADRVLFEERVDDASSDHFAWHRVRLPPPTQPGESGNQARDRPGSEQLRFSVEGALAHTAFAAPVVVPELTSQVTSGGDAPPNIVLFLADTFRADNLTAYGGTLGITPSLDTFAGRGRTFRRAWSVSTHTLPAHATIFSGLYPHQAGIADDGYALPEAAATLAEHLAGAGYRTGAVTDSLLVSDSRGISQGFEYFDERLHTLPDTVDRAMAFLDADDGRPTFLFVHTYRTHTPYRVSPRTHREIGERLGIPSTDGPGQRDVVLSTRRLTSLDAPEVQQLIRGLEARYRGGVADLDRGFGGFLKRLESRGFFEDGAMLFTSDHGEAFGEHNVLYHQGVVWDELLRVPFVLFGRGVEAGVDTRAVSLLDVAPTLADLAGLPPEDSWQGESVLGRPSERTLFSFQTSAKQQSTLAILQGARKLIGFENADALRAGKWLAAFDLEADPLEQRDLSDSARWPAEMLEAASTRAAQLLVPVLTLEPATLDADEIERLKAMGYLLEE